MRRRAAVFWLTMTSRATPDAPPEVALTPAEIAVLDRIAGGSPETVQRTVSHYLVEVAKLGGDLARTNGPTAGQHGRLARTHPTKRSVPGL